MAVIDMSYSRLSTYDMCAAKYFYRYVVKEDGVFGAAAALGKILHSVLEETIEPGVPPNLPEMVVTYEAQRAVHDPEREISDELIEAGYQMLTEFVARHEGETFEVLGREVEFNLLLGSALVRGYIDRIDRESDFIRVVDYKSGSYEVPLIHIHNDLQLGIYALAVSRMYPGERVYAELYYLRSGKRKGHFFSEEDLARVETRVLAQVNEIIERRHFHTTNNVRICSFCDYRISGTCPTGVARYRYR